ncbi:MAG: hypothetical protein ACOYZ8_16820 [Chloroflexota bacterium]
MEEQGEFFSSKHKRLLNIATWAKYLAWVVLIIYVLYALSTYTQEQTHYAFNRGPDNQIAEFNKYLTDNPTYGISILIKMSSIFLSGIVNFLVLKGISLGLNMIVETDINYREEKSMEGNNGE